MVSSNRTFATSGTTFWTTPKHDEATEPKVFTVYTAYFGTSVNGLFACLDILLGIYAIILNCIVISFYFKKTKKIVPFMYFSISTCDLLTGMVAILSGAIFIIIETKGVPYHLTLVHNFVFGVTAKVSVLLTLLITNIRTLNLVLPFMNIPRRNVILIAVFYTSFWAGFLAYEILRFYPLDPPSEPRFLPSVADKFYKQMQWNIFYDIDASGWDNCRNALLVIGLCFAVPSSIALVCLVVQIVFMTRSSNMRKTCTRTQKNQSNITCTITLLTLVFFICNTVYIFYVLMSLDCQLIRVPFVKNKTKMNITAYTMGVVFPFINSAINPAILILRSQGLKTHLSSLFSRRRSVRSGSGRKPATVLTTYKTSTKFFNTKLNEQVNYLEKAIQSKS